MGLGDVQNLLIGGIVFVLILSGGVIFVSSLYSAFGGGIDSTNQISEFNRTLNKAEQVTSAANNIRSSIDSVNSNEAGVLGWINALFGSIYYTLKTTISSLSFIGTAIEESVSYFGYDIVTPLVTLVGLIVVIIIAFAIWSAVTRQVN